MKLTFLFLVVITSFDWTASSPPNFNYDFTGFHQLTKLLTTNCNDIEGQVCIILSGSVCAKICMHENFCMKFTFGIVMGKPK